MNPENLRYILGLKLRKLRQERGYGLKELSALTGLSISYLSEIEKGRKYPKPDKILQLAEGLGVPFDDLVSLKVDEDLDPVKAIVSSNFIQGFPFQLFGLQPADVLGLVTEVPNKAGALVRTFLDIARTYDVRVEHFLFAALRSYQQMHSNHFEELERAAAAMMAENDWNDAPTVTAAPIKALLESRFGYRVTFDPLPEHPSLHALRAIHLEDRRRPTLIVNPRLLPAQQAFVLARELGYRVLDLKERSFTSSALRVTSFDQVINDFKAAYFAGALLIPQAGLSEALRAFFARTTWSSAAFHAIMARYNATPEMFFYRLSQLLPHRFGLKELFFLRFNHGVGGARYLLTKILNLSQMPIPHGIGLNEHHCRRWPGAELLREMDAAAVDGQPPEPSPSVAVQRSRFLHPDAEFLVVSMSRPLVLSADTNASVSLGIAIDDESRRQIAFVGDPAVPTREVNLTCERCPLKDCAERAADP
ncbi:MAG: XRE family transcriptional regulator, partial [Acidobacteriota bacterium]